MGKYEEGTKLKDARNNQIYPWTKAEFVEGLDKYIGGSITPPDDAAENSVPITNEQGDVEWVELQAGNISVKVASDVFNGSNLEEVLMQISTEIKKLEEKVNNTPVIPEDPGSVPSGFIPVQMSELPETGEVGIVYRVPSENPSSLNVYDEFYWTGDKFEKIGHRDPGGDEWGSEDNDSGYEWIE